MKTGTKWEELLNRIVNRSDMDKTDMTAIVLMIESEEASAEMLRWMDSNPQATREDILDKAIELSPDMDEED